MYNLDEIKYFVENEENRIPLHFRNNKNSAIKLIKFIEDNDIKIINNGINVLKNWVDLDIEKSEYSRVYTIENTRNVQPTYDLSINDGHSYVANGIICHNTTNLPKNTPESVVHDVYMTAWKAGCKGATIYVDGSRSGVLVTEEDNKETEIENYFKENHAPKRPKTLEADVHNFTNKGEKWVAVIGKLENKPYEIFTGPSEEFKIETNIENGEITRVKDNNGNSIYNFCYEKDGDKICVGDLKGSFDPQFSDISRMVSALLRHGMPMFYIVNLLGTLNLDGDLITTWKKGAIRILKKYIKEEEQTKGKTCDSCGSTNVAMIEGCFTCLDCNFSGCS